MLTNWTLTKAFDKVNHRKLCLKLEHIALEVNDKLDQKLKSL